MRRTLPAVLTLTVALVSVGYSAEPGDVPAPSPPTVVLDTGGIWRMHVTLRPPVLSDGQKTEPVLFNLSWIDRPTTEPDEDWTATEFDDSPWLRGPALTQCRSQYAARLCFRGKFRVTDPAKVDGLRLTLGYRGGARVLVNGREVRRAHLPEGDLTPEVLAEAYPTDAFMADGGKPFGRRTKRTEENNRRLASRNRLLEDVPIPPGMLTKGINVVAIEIVRSPYDKILTKFKEKQSRGGPGFTLDWYTCELRRVQLSADGPAGLVPNATRPSGLQVWNSDPMASDFDLDFGDTCQKLAPVRIVVARNGRASGKVVVGSDAAIRGLGAVASDLRGPGGATLPAASVRLRYAVPWGNEYRTIPYQGRIDPYAHPANLLGALLEMPPVEVPVRSKPKPRGRSLFLNLPNQPDTVFGAVVPVWITVAAPADAQAGLYKGTVTIRAEGADPVAVPLEVHVADWTLPKLEDYTSWLELMQSPDTLTYQYKLQPWSERHWEMIARSFKHIGETSSRVVHVPLLAETNLGNAESMVRWIKKADGTYDHDLTIFDRYLDTAMRNMGTPKIVCFWVWEIYMLKSEKERSDHLWLKNATAARKKFRGKGPMVTMLDPKTGRTWNEHLTPYEDPASDALWRPLVTALSKRLEARGLAKTMMFGMMNDIRPTKAEVSRFNDMRPGTPWVCHSHGTPRHGRLYQGVVPMGYSATVWSTSFASGEPEKPMYGWKREHLVVDYERSRSISSLMQTTWRHIVEWNITGGQRGSGRIGADFWPVMKDKRGRLAGYVWSRYVQSSWRNLDLHGYTLCPGPDGPVPTTRFEALREGMQECEARIAIERVLSDPEQVKRLGDDLEARCRKLLADRTRAMFRSLSMLQMSHTRQHYPTCWRTSTGLAGYRWYLQSLWQDRNLALYTLAGEVERKLGR
jgi:Glycoside hydrolase 123, catalytic domain